MNKLSYLVKYFLALILVVIFRFIPHPPNIEPITASMMPFAKRYGAFAGLIFSSLSVFMYDYFSGSLGRWSLLTAGTYALLAFLAAFYLRDKRRKTRYFFYYAIFSTLVFDTITGLSFGIFLFNQSLLTTIEGQIPFTAYHLLGNGIFSLTLSPLIEKWIVNNYFLEKEYLLKKLKFSRG